MKPSRWLLAGGSVAFVATIAWFGAGAIGRQIWQAAWVVPFALTIHAVQLLVSAQAWRRASGAATPSLARWWLARWVREAVNSMLPVAQLGGNVVGVRLLARSGVPLAQASAGVTLDLTLEALAQFAFTLGGIAVLAVSGANRAWVPWFASGLGLLALGIAGFLVAQRLGALRLVEAAVERFARWLPGGRSVVSLRGLHAELLRLQRDRAALLEGFALHLTAWLLGCGETWLALAAMGQSPSWRAVLAIESLGMAARSAGFVVPGALGVQEGGFILVGGLFGLSADSAIALSMVKRARELIVGAAGLLAWQWSELRRPEPTPGARAVAVSPAPESPP